MNFLYSKKSNKIFLILIFFVIFTYYLTFLPPNDKLSSFYFDGANQDFKTYYGLWGLLNDYLYKFLNLLLGKFIPGFILFELILAFQLSTLWTLNIFRYLNELNIFAIIFFFNPFVLNFFTLCLRDAIAVAIFLLVVFKGWNKFKLMISLLIAFSIHKGILPLIFISTLFNKYKNKSKKYFFGITLFSIIISLIVFVLLRYTDVAQLIPDSFYNYKKVLSYPRIGFTADQDISHMVKRAYNFYGNFNFKILIFGIIGQLLTVNFKEKFPYDMFSFCFGTFFICSALSSVPNASRFIYHAVLISFPFIISFSIYFFRKKYRNFFN